MAETGQDIERAAQLLRDEEVVAIPTETVYGLAGRIRSEKAIRQIFQVKNRPLTDPLIVHVAGIEEIYPLVSDFPVLAKKLLEAFSPGPITILFPKSDQVSNLITNGSPFVAIRIPNHPLTLALLKVLGEPLAAPSANPFGGISPTKAEHVESGLGQKIPYILDGGPCEVGLESTIVQITGKDKIRILRKGGISEEELALFSELMLEENTLETVVPGSMISHYAPQKPVYFLSDQSLPGFDLLQTGVLCFQKYAEGYRKENQIVLSPDGNLVEAAKNLFDALHQLDQMDIKTILVDSFPDTGLGKAINDRLERASKKKENG